MTYQQIRELTANEAICWKKVLDLRQQFKPEMFSDVKVDSRQHCLERGVYSVQKILQALEAAGIELSKMEPGHGLGHIVRDYINTLRLLSKLDIDPKHAFIGFIAGVLHDIGTALVDRYKESKRAVRHAEVGALLVGWTIENADVEFTDTEKLLVQYAICAHTHYLRASDVVCEDGETRHIEPYTDKTDGKPLYGFWIARWVDRLDCSGSCFVGRHYLTLHRLHEDFGTDGYYQVEFSQHMQPWLWSDEDIKRHKQNRTMAEHLRMFANSQTNDSPYGKHDFGRMVELRDPLRESLLRILNRLGNDRFISLNDKNMCLQSWYILIANHIEKGPVAEKAAKDLDQQFSKLDERSQIAWLNAFHQTVREYMAWLTSVLDDFEEFPLEWQQLTEKCNVINFVGAVSEWAKVITKDYPVLSGRFKKQ